ncbi:helix-turn-helix transcriptional regulator [Lactococcus carnosus]|uniref:helix-turn-helix transcriptional regulator n=1 Tax=Pseudolactococcus carnosus TaxID=2749961 RepID=UPI001FB8E392|nr:helix-turn-helix transcriptional regulator [Lactococcus carnosus]MCJ1979613.1 helix-turn-helix transcriptional regulator [Lactococcus carnosus]
MVAKLLVAFRAVNDAALQEVDGGSLANNIRTLRLEKQVTQEILARELFVTRQAVSQWENGLRDPSIDNLIQMKEFFQVSFDRLLS